MRRPCMRPGIHGPSPSSRKSVIESPTSGVGEVFAPQCDGYAATLSLIRVSQR
jgi:hypothetical protein